MNQKCKHKNTVNDTLGSIVFSAGEIFENFRTVTICLDCLVVLENGDEDTTGIDADTEIHEEN